MSMSSHTNFKVVLMGDPAVGKTQLITRILHDKYSDSYASTPGSTCMSFQYKSTTQDKLTDYESTLKLWDTSGQSRYEKLTETHLKDANAIIICYDPATTSFENLDKWIGKAKKHPSIPIMLLSMKHDQTTDDKKAESSMQLTAKATEIGAILYFEVSAKDKTNVTKAFEALATTLNEVYFKLLKEQKERDAALEKALNEQKAKQAERIVRIHAAIHTARKTKFKKGKNWSDEVKAEDDETPLFDKIEKHAAAPHRTTAKAKELDEKYPDWDNLLAPKYEEHRKTLIQDGCRFSQSKSGLFKKPARDLSSLSLDDIEMIPTIEPESRTGLFVSTLRKPAT